MSLAQTLNDMLSSFTATFCLDEEHPALVLRAHINLLPCLSIRLL